jgi:NTP pyrophosphatase (non-canonical NTP hydrolase)
VTQPAVNGIRIERLPSRLAEMAKEADEDSRRWFPDTANDLFFLTACMAAEGGEAVNKLKKAQREGRKMTPVEKHEFVMELIDVQTYLLDCFALVGVDPERAYYQKRTENERRFGNGRNS